MARRPDMRVLNTPVPNLLGSSRNWPRWVKLLCGILAASSIPATIFTGITTYTAHWATATLRNVATRDVKAELATEIKSIQATDASVAALKAAMVDGFTALNKRLDELPRPKRKHSPIPEAR